MALSINNNNLQRRHANQQWMSPQKEKEHRVS